ncbi:hypothetical protein [Desulfoglaeba alkanexedens]|uniref:Uncharacterized protein n=1 Tax=Desulfoglaeba alkanexedens ALDC TaxID=980445 RepID=A0A4P8L2X2_9BACT|nr:hypothetical protein [Desulfoglaeba alkanexedens]QCQ22277.1 hypothetical protein FDQ92_08960 [Desulfoglaeba alkanexedens ALDC]
MSNYRRKVAELDRRTAGKEERSRFRRWKMRRFAEVGSEILFRRAANVACDGARDMERFKTRLRRCRGLNRGLKGLPFQVDVSLAAAGRHVPLVPKLWLGNGLRGIEAGASAPLCSQAGAWEQG